MPQNLLSSLEKMLIDAPGLMSSRLPLVVVAFRLVASASSTFFKHFFSKVATLASNSEMAGTGLILLLLCLFMFPVSTPFSFTHR